MHTQLEARKVLDDTPYGYYPTVWVGIVMTTLFILSTLIHSVQAIRYRMWFMILTAVLAGILESIGWAGRLWSAYDVQNQTADSIQLICTIIGPTPLIAANFIILGHVIRRLGQQYSRLSARLYSIVFLSCDVIALVIQALGGATAAAASNSGKSPNPGVHIMLGGIIFQTVAITFYILLGGEFLLRYYSDKPLHNRVNFPTPYSFDRKMRLMIAALIFSSLCFYVRTWYRCIELGDGWQGTVITTERYFVIMDALMITFAIWTLNLFHPGRLLGYGTAWRNDKILLTNTPQNYEEAAGKDNTVV